jgi:hypothetical protein
LKLLSNLSAWCYRVVTPLILLFALILFALFMVLVLPSMAGRLADLTGAAVSPDTSFIYSAGDLYLWRRLMVKPAEATMFISVLLSTWSGRQYTCSFMLL